MKFQVYKDNIDQFCWRLKNNTEKTIANSAECYLYKDDCLEAIRLVRHSSLAELEDQSQVAA